MMRLEMLAALLLFVVATRAALDNLAIGKLSAIRLRRNARQAHRRANSEQPWRIGSRAPSRRESHLMPEC